MMKLESSNQTINIVEDGTITINLGPFTLSDGYPTVNDARINAIDVEHLAPTSDIIQITYKTADFSLRLEAQQMEDNTLEIRMAIQNFTLGTTWSNFGLRFDSVTGANRAMRQGFYSWDGTEFFNLGDTLQKLDIVDAHIGFSPQHSHSVTALLDNTNTAVIGVTETKQMPQTFLFTTNDTNDITLDIGFHWENASTSDLTQLVADPLRLLIDTDTETALRHWAEIFADKMGGARIAGQPMRGWCSWYYYYYFATEQDIEENLNAAIHARDEEGIPLDVFMIDANHFADLGDWLEPNLHYYPNGQPRLIQMIKEAGFIPGLWIAPFWVSNRSKLYQENPDWVVQDPKGGPLIINKCYGEQRIWCYRAEEAYALDTTHPDALAYLQEVIETWRKWGVAYFKTDFMFQGIISGVRHDPTKNRMRVWRETAETLRDAMGDAYWSGCGQPIFASVGLVDANRISGDVGPVWHGDLSQEPTLRDTTNRHYMHNTLWQNDPDCIMLRDFHHEMTDIEIKGLGLYAAMSGGLYLTSDPLHLIRSDRRDLLKFLAPRQTSTPRAPFMGQDYDTLKCFVSDVELDCHIVFLFNTGEIAISKKITLTELGLSERLYGLEWMPERDLGEVEEITVDLAPHDYKLIYLKLGDFGDWKPEYLLDFPVR